VVGYSSPTPVGACPGPWEGRKPGYVGNAGRSPGTFGEALHYNPVIQSS